MVRSLERWRTMVFCFVLTVLGVWRTNLGSTCQIVASGYGFKCLRFNEREDYPVVVFHDGLSKASPVLRSQSQKVLKVLLLLPFWWSSCISMPPMWKDSISLCFMHYASTHSSSLTWLEALRPSSTSHSNLDTYKYRTIQIYICLNSRSYLGGLPKPL